MSVRKRREALPELNLTPLLDVIFNLIFFFVLGTSIKAKESVIEMRLPASETATAAPVERMPPRVAVLADGRLLLDGAETTPEALRAALERRRADTTETRVLLETEADVTMQQLVSITDLCRKAGMKEVSPRVRPAPKE